MTVDVNQAFAGERERQIAAAHERVAASERRAADYAASWDKRVADGKLIPMGGDRYAA